jgi:plastocyanin
METEEKSGPPRAFYIGMTLLMVVIGGALAGVFIFKLQPQLSSGGVNCPSGTACIIMPANAAVVNFSPVNMTVVMGVNNTIQWTNKDTIQHTVVVCQANGPQECAPSAAVASSTFLSQGDTFTVTLNSTGVYHYFCSIHPATMKATIVVKAAGS